MYSTTDDEGVHDPNCYTHYLLQAYKKAKGGTYTTDELTDIREYFDFYIKKKTPSLRVCRDFVTAHSLTKRTDKDIQDKVKYLVKN